MIMGDERTRADDPAYDVLAAEAFAVPAPDPELRHGPDRLPDDQAGVSEPHGVPVADEFRMALASRSRGGRLLVGATRSCRRPGAAGVGAAVLLAVLALRMLRGVRAPRKN